MTGQEMVKYINQLSSSARIQSVEGNYGVGAKIAAATRNHAGLIYLSWQDGRGTMIHLWRDPQSGQYGLRQIQRPDGTYGHFAEVDDAIKPALIDQHGTRIVLYGMTADADTMKAPPDAASPSQWIAKYLNTRYFKFPADIAVRARQGWEQPRSNKDVNLLRTLTGQAHYLESHKEFSGEVPLTDAVAQWWILKDEGALSQNSGFIESSGHVAALHNDELYEMAVCFLPVIIWFLFELQRMPYRPPQDMSTLLGGGEIVVVHGLLGMFAVGWLICSIALGVIVSKSISDHS